MPRSRIKIPRYLIKMVLTWSACTDRIMTESDNLIITGFSRLDFPLDFIYLKCYKCLRLRSLCRNYNHAISSFIIYHWIVDKSSLPFRSIWVHTLYFVQLVFPNLFFMSFLRSTFSWSFVFLSFSFGHCIVCPSLIYLF